MVLLSTLSTHAHTLPGTGTCLVVHFELQTASSFNMQTDSTVTVGSEQTRTITSAKHYELLHSKDHLSCNSASRLASSHVFEEICH